MHLLIKFYEHKKLTSGPVLKIDLSLSTLIKKDFDEFFKSLHSLQELLFN
jgi:hypothetical protein